jgi:hypothetical protein
MRLIRVNSEDSRIDLRILESCALEHGRARGLTQLNF